MKRVALFTPFSPDIGGGATNLRSVIPLLEDLDVTWFHLGPAAHWSKSRSIGQRLIGQRDPARDFLRTAWMWWSGRTRHLAALAETIHNHRADVNWVVAHNEGVLLGNLLSQLGPATKLHVSVHDDPPRTTLARARRYRAFRFLAFRPFERLLRCAASVDVTSDGMKRYYDRRYSLDTIVVHPYVEKISTAAAKTTEPSRLRIGHLGSIYDWNPVKAFASGLLTWAARRGREIEMLTIGSGPKTPLDKIFGEIGHRHHEHLAEAAAIEELRQCDILYAMYPFDQRSSIFRQTSMPTKLSTYVAAARPILAHTPTDSTLAALVDKFKIGAVISRCERSAIGKGLDDILAQTVEPSRFERVREETYGLRNVAKLHSCLDTSLLTSARV